ncbi:MAG: hypothetical protein HOO99_18615 [Hyphomicrobiaceae bacterium]|nr:hypothetical protein [Hyphomicrobiaceae bacterium]
MVVAHPEPQSYNAHLARIGRETLQAHGWSVTVSDLYQMNFDPCGRHGTCLRACRSVLRWRGF